MCGLPCYLTGEVAEIGPELQKNLSVWRPSMRHTPPRAFCAVLCFFVCLLLGSFAVAQSPDPQPAPTPDPTTATDDQSATVPPDATAAAATDPDQLADTDSADVPSFLKGLIDTEQYLRMRNSHIRRLRGLMDPAFGTWRRNGAIYNMQQREQQLQEASATGNGDPGFVGPVTPNAPAPAIPASLLTSWTALGPAPIPNGQTTAVSQAVSGRVTVIVVHPTNENIVYVGTAQGGLYRSLNGGATWTALTDNALSLAIGSIAIDPLDPTTLVVGTGEGNLSTDSFFGVGVYLIKNADTD